MQDLYMVLILGGTYGLLMLFMSWCGRVISEPEGISRDNHFNMHALYFSIFDLRADSP